MLIEIGAEHVTNAYHLTRTKWKFVWW